MIFLDSETMGFSGPMVLFQYAQDDGPIHIHDVWASNSRDTCALFEWLTTDNCIAYNMGFDWFHVVQAYNILRLCPPGRPPRMSDWLKHQREATLGPFLKPPGVLDLYLHALKGPLQGMLQRDDIYIRKVPNQLVEPLIAELKRRVRLDPLYFIRADGKQWYVSESKTEGFSDVSLRFTPSAKLKPLVEHLFGIEVREIALPDHVKVNDSKVTWNPFNNRWVDKFAANLRHWRSPAAMAYAEDDVEHLRRLYEHWDRPGFDDDDSLLTVSVANSRWRGFAVDVELAKEVGRAAYAKRDIGPRSPAQALAALHAVASDVQRMAITSTKAEKLKAIENWPGEVGKVAKSIRMARKWDRRATAMAKLVQTEGSLHLNYKVIGTKSFRMSGTGGLNAQGQENAPEVRAIFTLVREEGYMASGFDFNSYEVSIAAAVYKSPELTRMLKSGMKFHAILGELAGKGKYKDIMATESHGKQSKYARSKAGTFAYMYGAAKAKLAETLDIDEASSEEFLKRLAERFPKVAEARNARMEQFESMKQPGGLGTKVIWREPAEYAETFLGDRRYYTLENEVCRQLFGLAQKLPRHIVQRGAFEVQRRSRTQTASGALCSALYAAAFGIQGSNCRSAANNDIQSPGGRITKHVQRAIWDFQPVGVHHCHVQQMNSHDELVIVHLDELHDAIKEKVQAVIDSYRDKVPLLAMDWKSPLKSWADLK